MYFLIAKKVRNHIKWFIDIRGRDPGVIVNFHIKNIYFVHVFWMSCKYAQFKKKLLRFTHFFKNKSLFCNLDIWTL